MKVSFFTPTLELHGGTLVMVGYANELARLGHKITIISPAKGGGLPLDPKICVVTYSAWPIRYLDTILLQRPYWRRIEKLVEEVDFLIPIYTPLLVPVLRAKQRRRLKAKVILIGQEAFEMPLIGSYNRKLLQRPTVVKALSQVVAISEPMATIYRQLVGQNKVTRITNGIDRNLFKPRPHIPKTEELLFVGRPVFVKGYPAYKAAVIQLKHKFPQLKATLIAPGIDAKMDGPIRWQPFTTRTALAESYNRAAVYVCSSSAESFGLPSLEAMASGTAVVTTSTVGAAQYALDQENCLTVPINDVPALVAAIDRLLTDKNLAHSLIKNGQVTAAHYDQKTSLTKFTNLLNKLAAN